jgi:hypothetical protein
VYSLCAKATCRAPPRAPARAVHATDVISGDFTEADAKKLQKFGPSENEGPAVSDASGSVKFWIKDGALTKYEFKLKGKTSFNGNEFPNERTTTVEIKDLGKTKLEVPEEVRKKAAS